MQKCIDKYTDGRGDLEASWGLVPCSSFFMFFLGSFGGDWVSTLDDFIAHCVEVYYDTSSVLKTRGSALVESEERATRYRKTRIRQKVKASKKRGKTLTPFQVERLETSYKIAYDQYRYKQAQSKKLTREAKNLIGESRKESITAFFSRIPMLCPVDPHSFYSSIFRGYLDITDAFSKGAYTGIVTQIHSNGDKRVVHRYSITDGLIELDNLIKSSTAQDFSFLAPISYCGKRATAEASRFLFAFAIDLDDLVVSDDGVPTGLYNLFYQLYDNQLPEPTYLVSSGTGVHLYYVFDDPIPLWQDNKILLSAIRKKLVQRIWNSFITASYKPSRIQYESIYQGFRVVGTATKTGSICRAYKWGNGDTVDLSDLLPYLYDTKEVSRLTKTIKPKTKYNYAQLLEKFPDWTKRHFGEDGKPLPKAQQVRLFGGWTASPKVYQWFLKRITAEVQSGHRYHSLMCLAAYAQKCGVDYPTFEHDCWGLYETYKKRTVEATNPWTKSDVKSVLKTYGNPKSRYLSIDAISSYSGIQISKNKRNYRKQAVHLARARAVQKIDYPNNEWAGRRPKRDVVQAWRAEHPDGRKIDCERETGLSRHTVIKWWDS